MNNYEMKIAIHKSGEFVERWIAYCEANRIQYKIINCYDNDIIEQLDDCDALMWHHFHASHKDVKFAKQLLFSLEQAGKIVFPNFNTAWHFDDKVGQKYLLEAIKAPMVPSYVFYSKKDALKWAESASFPKVFKLRGGAGSSNVRLVQTQKIAKKLIYKAFGRGFAQYDKLGNLKDRWRKYRQGKTTLFDVLKGCVRIFHTTDFARMVGNEKGYVYFQDFVPNNHTDYRIKIVNGYCWGFQRKVRDKDFRASGSGELIYDNSQIPLEMIKTAFTVNKKLKLQSVAFDFLMQNSLPLIIEMSYGFGFDNEQMQHGYWDADLIWHEGNINPFGWMIEIFLRNE